MREEVKKAGYSISAGYAMRTDGEDIDDILRLSDSDMYVDKREYYENQAKQEKKPVDRPLFK